MQPLSALEFVTRLAVGVGCGALIGVERQWRARMAGLRTNGQHVRPGQQSLQPAAYHKPEPPGGRRGEGLIEPAATRGHHALNLPGGRRLYLLAPAAPPQRRTQPVPVRLCRAHLLGQPLRPAVLVILGRRARPVYLADL